MSRVVAGIQPVREAIRALGSRIEKIQILDRPHQASPTLAALARFASDQGINVEPAPYAALDRIAGDARHQGAIAIVPDLPVLNLDELLATDSTLVVALDRIADPQNFGAIVRSAVAFGANGILWPEHSSAPLALPWRAPPRALSNMQGSVGSPHCQLP